MRERGREGEKRTGERGTFSFFFSSEGGLLWGNARRTVKRNSQKRDKDAHSGAKCDEEKLPPAEGKHNSGMREWMLKVASPGKAQLTMARKMSVGLETMTRAVFSPCVNFG